MSPIALEWLNALLRWIHIIAGIMWIGDSLLFMWIDSHLRPDPQGRRDVTGVTWLIHGGGYYHLEKRMLVPGHLPPRLRWFWLEATTTWLSGFLLLVLIYYLSADAFMIDRSVSGLTAGQSIAVGVGMLVGGWFLYDGIWRSPLHERPTVGALVSFILLVAVLYAVTGLLSARAAFIHVGAMLGTIMAANVWVHVLPPQRQMVQAAREVREIDYSLGIYAKTRSTHNTYLTFPVIFLMISQHFPAIHAASPNWLVLALIVLAGAGIRHVMLVGFRTGLRTAAATLLAATTLVYLTVRPLTPQAETGPPAAGAPAFVEVRTIVTRRCTPCHSEVPTASGVAAPPGSIRMDTPRQIKALAARIKARAVEQKTMPPANATGLTDEERAVLGRWVDVGAPLR